MLNCKECRYFERGNQYGNYCQNKNNMDIRPNKNKKGRNHPKRCMKEFCPLWDWEKER